MDSSNCLESFVYPLKQTLRFEVDDIESLGIGRRFGPTLRVGKSDWHILVSTSNLPIGEKYLAVYLRCQRTFRDEEKITVERSWKLLNQEISDDDFRREGKSGVTVYKAGSNSYGCSKFMNWVSLMNDGFVKNGKIIVECDLKILSENVSSDTLDFETSRPNNEDLKSMMTVDGYQVARKIVEKEIELAQVSENDSFTDTVYIDGFPCKVGICKKQEASKDCLICYLYCNSDDKSEWWGVEAAAEFRIKSRNSKEKFLSKSMTPKLFQEEYANETDGNNSLIIWDELIDPKNGYVKYGRIIIETFIYIRNKYGFNEKTGRGIEKPMKKMTDAVILIDDEKFNISRMILSHQSSWFCELFYINPDKTEFVLSEIDKDLFTNFLKLAYNGSITVNENNIEKLLVLLDRYRADECIRRFDFQIKDMKINDDMKMLKLINKYYLPNMKARFVKKLRDINELRKIFRDPDVFKLSDQLRVELTLDDIIESEDDREQYYTYSKQNYETQKVNEPREKIHKFFTENDEAKKLLEDPELQNVGNDLLSLLANNSEDSDSEVFKISFKEFCDRSDMVIFNLEDGNNFYSSKQILAHASRYFMKRFFGPDAKDDEKVIIFDGIPSNNFSLLLNHIYHPTKSIKDENLDILLSLAHRFGVMDLLNKCEDYLIKTETLSVSKKSEYGTKYSLEFLSSACLTYSDRGVTDG